MKYLDLFEAEGHEGGAAKKFEDDLVTLALLSSNNPDKSLEEVYDAHATEFASPGHKKQTIQAITKLNERFPGEKWTSGSNSNFGLQDAPSPAYGVKSAKSDIVLNDKAISVKLDTAFVVASAQNKEEFAGIFDSALDYYMQTKGNDLDVSDAVDGLKRAIQTAKNDYVGEVKNRILPEARKLKVINKFSDVKVIYEGLQEHIAKVEQDATDAYAEATKVLKNEILKTIQATLKDNPELKQYITWEALSSSIKYNFQFPYAQWVLSPKGVHSVQKPDDPYVVACSKVSKFDIRGLPTGKMRSGTSAFAKYYKKQLADGNDVDIAAIYDEMNKMAFSMKMDVSAANLKKLDVNEAFDIKALFKRILDKINEWIQALAKKFDSMLGKLDALKSGTLQGWMAALDIEPVAEIVLPE